MSRSVERMMRDLRGEEDIALTRESLVSLDAQLNELRRDHNAITVRLRQGANEGEEPLFTELEAELTGIEAIGKKLRERREQMVKLLVFHGVKPNVPPQLGERLLLLILTKEERVNIPGDLAEEFAEIAAKQGQRFAKLWYYKQVTASAWPMFRKGIRLGLFAWVAEWVRRFI